MSLSAQAASTLRTSDARVTAAIELRNEAERLRDAGQRDSSLRLLDDALLLFNEVGDRGGETETRRVIGTVALVAGRPREAIAPLEEALRLFRILGDRVGEGRSLSNLGMAYEALGIPDSAFAHYRASLVLRRTTGDIAGEATTLNNLGLAFLDAGQRDSAITNFRAALRLALQLGSVEEEARVLNSLGNAFRLSEQLDSAQIYYRLSAQRYRVVGDFRSAASILINAGMVDVTRGELDAAEGILQEGLSTLAGNDRYAEGTIHLNLALIHRRRGRHAEARIAALRAKDIGQQTGLMSIAAGAHEMLGNLFLDSNKPDSALAQAQMSYGFSRAAGNADATARALWTIARINQFYLTPRRPDLARAYYDSAAAIRSGVLRGTDDDEARLGITESVSNLYAAWAQAWLDSEDIGGEDRKYAALAVHERGRAQALLQLLRQTSEVSAVAPVGEDLGGSVSDLPTEGRRLISRLRAQQNNVLALVVLGDRVERYALGQEGGGVIDFVYISQDSLARLVALARAGLGVDSASARTVTGLDDLRGVVTPASGQDGLAALRTLAELLVDNPARNLGRRGNSELLIVANGPLAMVPFAALPIDSAGTPLGSRFAIRYAPSLTAAAEIGALGAAPQGNALIVGNPTMPQVPRPGAPALSLTSLPGSDTEAQWIAEQFSVIALRGGAATEAEVKRLMPSASVIHLATHGMAFSSAERARDSFVALAPGRGEDGLLTVGEVLDALPALRAELVVLSACQTGLGNLRQAEGTVGLQRAFLAKGARSVLVSLWSVSDEATDLLMRSFYREWMAGATKPEALRRAQVQVRAEPESRFHHPRFWAAFQLVGAP